MLSIVQAKAPFCSTVSIAFSIASYSPFPATTDDANSFDASRLSINRRQLFPIVHIQRSLLFLQKAVVVVVIVDFTVGGGGGAVHNSH